MADFRTIETRIHGRYLVRGADPRRVLVGFHGYAENAAEHLAQLEQIPGAEEWTLVAVQGLNRFYRGRTEVVVASWMTREDREQGIADNLVYVRAIVDTFPDRERLAFLGFSQGAAMAYRAAAAIHAAALLVLGGDFPPDVDPAALPPVLIGRGERDDWYTAEKLQQDLRFLPTATVVQLDAGHEWTDGFRAAAGRFLDRR